MVSPGVRSSSPRTAQTVIIIDQTRLPHQFVTTVLATLGDAAHAIGSMLVRGAPLIGATAAYGMALAMRRNASDAAMVEAARALLATRPHRGPISDGRSNASMARLRPLDTGDREQAAYACAAEICDEDVAICEAIGEHGPRDPPGPSRGIGRPGSGDDPLQCRLACHSGTGGTALAPVYKAHDAGIPVHVWVSETRPRKPGERP